MKPENKAALTVGAQTALVTAAAAILLPNPVSWAAAIVQRTAWLRVLASNL